MALRTLSAHDIAVVLGATGPCLLLSLLFFFSLLLIILSSFPLPLFLILLSPSFQLSSRATLGSNDVTADVDMHDEGV